MVCAGRAPKRQVSPEHQAAIMARLQRDLPWELERRGVAE
jgi:hypothetical protein